MSSHVQRDLEAKAQAPGFGKGLDGLLPSIVEIPQPLRFKKAYIWKQNKVFTKDLKN